MMRLPRKAHRRLISIAIALAALGLAKPLLAQASGAAAGKVEAIQKPQSPQAQVLAAFLQCDAQFFKLLGQHAEALIELRPMSSTPTGLAFIAVPERSNEEGQALTLKPAFTVGGVDFIEFIDEIAREDSLDSPSTPTASATATASATSAAAITSTPLASTVKTSYYWGFNTDAKLAQVLPVVQALLPPAQQLTADEDTWARLAVFEQGAWRNVPDHALLKGKPATLPERALIVQRHEGGGTRVICGLQAAPLPATELKRLRPDL